MYGWWCLGLGEPRVKDVFIADAGRCVYTDGRRILDGSHAKFGVGRVCVTRLDIKCIVVPR